MARSLKKRVEETKALEDKRSPEEKARDAKALAKAEYLQAELDKAQRKRCI